VLFASGLVAIFLGPLARFYISPKVKKIPTDFYFREVAQGTGSYVLPTKGFAQVGPVPVQNVTIQKGSVADSTASVAVWDQFTSLVDTQNQHQITYEISRLTLDKKTAVSIDCCGENENRAGSLTALFPIGTQKKTYSFWDFNAKKGYPIEYKNTTTIDGLTVYRFHQRIDPVQINSLKLPGTLVGSADPAVVQYAWEYTSDTDIWVEPVTGGVVKGAQVADQYLADASGTRVLTLAHVDATWDAATVKDAVDKASAQKSQLKLIDSGIPLFGPIAGVLMLVIGLLLIRGSSPPTPVGARVPIAAPAA
jgi:hypothetical protein